jgi:hypothetical protein
MRPLCLTSCLLAVLLSSASAREPAATPFWLLPKSELDPRRLVPADVKLISAPDLSREFALLQVGNDDPRNYVSRVSGTDRGYRLVPGGLKVGASTYVDRTFSIAQLPEEFAGLTLLQTVLQHKPVVDERFVIELATAKPCWVFVAVDENALATYQQHGVPAWLQEYAPIGRQIVSDRANYPVFVKQAFPGRIALGPPCMDANANAMYFAFFSEAK